MARNVGAKILVVDDEVSLLNSIVAYLEDSGFKLYSASNAKDALALFAEHKPDLVLTDVHMPSVSGLELLEALTKEHQELPVIVISGAGQLNDAIGALRLGACDFIAKPIADLQVLEHSVNKALERKKLLEDNKNYLKALEDDQIAGRKLQMSLLPPEKFSVKGYNFDFKIVPSLELSGDFVEYFPIDEQRYGVYLADVSGHGASSAFITVLLKSLVARYLEFAGDVAKMLQVLNQEIYRAKLGKYLTLIYAVLDTNTNQLTYAIAGHYPSPILFEPNTAPRFLAGSGFPIGVMAETSYQIHSIIIQPEAKLFMFSDGIMETVNPQATLEQKEAKLLSVLSQSNHNIDEILTACKVDTNEQHAPPDDITILTLSRFTK